MVTNRLLLIHGAWQGSWAWDYIAPELKERGWLVHLVDLPGTMLNGAIPSLELYVGICETALAAFSEKVIIIGHSGGAVVAAQVAERLPERVAALVFLAGIMVPSGRSFSEVASELQSRTAEIMDGIESYLEWSDDELVSRVPKAAAATIFLHDCESNRVQEAGNKLQAQHEAGRALRPLLTDARFGKIPRLYVEAANDRSIPLMLQRYMQELVPGALRKTLPTGHAPQIADPVALANLLDTELRAAIMS
jgi:pimeloyl-ACP methyl ester carboxylesterase